MRIQHNIPAMSSYRNYINNTSALSKNLEKLSSGYKINRAGDDAAGLAISEKMRAQISGLAQAQANAKSGINLVQTAEGAMTEIHDMLNRMVTLADQSANGTYDNDVDRVQLQKEVNQLKDEINRIADSANFNGIKLLDGSLDENGRVANTTTTFNGLKIADNVNSKDNGVASADATKPGFSTDSGGLELTGTTAANGPRYHKEASGAGKTSFTIDLDNADYECSAGKTIKDLVFGLDGGADGVGDSADNTTGNCLWLDKNGTKKVKYTVTSTQDGITSENIATAIQKAIDDGGNGKVFVKLNGDKMVEYSVTRDGNKLNFQMTDDGYDTAVAATGDKNAKNYFTGDFNFAVNYKKLAAVADGDTDAVKLEKAFTSAVVNKQQHNASSIVKEGSPSARTILAEATIRFAETSTGADDGINVAKDVFKDGAGIQLGDEYYIFAKTDAVYNGTYADNVKVVDIRDLDLDSTTNAADATDDSKGWDADLRKALDRLSVAAKDNAMFNVQVSQNDKSLIINERSTYTGDADLTKQLNGKGLESQIQMFDSATSVTEVVKEAGKALTLQIGDTAESFNQMKVNISDMHTRSMGIGDIDISTQEGASAAVKKIQDAVNYVSDVRGTLGATQNRLDHTINNLGVMQENIQDAESTIRDTDVAAEMMEYTKNSILVQSAQAMLAQANQLPQGVLQLLQ